MGPSAGRGYADPPLYGMAPAMRYSVARKTAPVRNGPVNCGENARLCEQNDPQGSEEAMP